VYIACVNSMRQVFIRSLEHVYDVGQWLWCVLAGDEGRFVQLRCAEELCNDKVSLVKYTCARCLGKLDEAGVHPFARACV
jgi:hypothetical protein